MHPCGASGTTPWYGLKCDKTGTHIESIILSDNNLAGTLVSEIRGLVKLREYIQVESMIKFS
jgi:hypothetical protein